MRKFSILLALLAGAMLPAASFAQDTDSTTQETVSKYKEKKTNNTKKDNKKDANSAGGDAKAETKSGIIENELSDQQVMLNNDAFNAKKEGRLEAAEQIYNAMLLLGEFNIIWLNLASTYLDENKCMETADALAHVYTAPRITNVPHEELVKRAKEYEAQLKEKCSATITIKCDPADTLISLDNGKPMECNPNPITLVPGHHGIYGKTGFGFTNVDFDVAANEKKEVEVTVIDYEEVAKSAGVTLPKLREKSKLFKVLGYTFLGVGVATAGVGFGINGYYYFSYNSDDTDARTTKIKNQPIIHTGLALGIIGSAMIVTGITLVVYDVLKFQPQIVELEKAEKSKVGFIDFQLSPAISPEFTGLSFSATF